MIRAVAFAVLLAAAQPAFAQDSVSQPAVPEETPGFQAIRPAPDAAPAEPAPVLAPPPPAEPAPAPPPAPAMPAPEPAPPPSTPSATAPDSSAWEIPSSLPVWASGILVLCGALLAGLFGAAVSRSIRQSELALRRQAVAASLAAELETRKLAFDAVPLPPNVEAGVSFVSSVMSLAGIDAAFRSAQSDLFLLPATTASHLSVHYAAVQRVADFVKGQSLAAAVRMLQANRLGGHPCPDAGAMRDAHVEMSAAFRGVDKLIANLKNFAR
jgi:hypothetical protein